MWGRCCSHSPHLGVVARCGELPDNRDVFSDVSSERCLLLWTLPFFFSTVEFLYASINHCFQMFIFGFLFVCVFPMMWQVLGTMPAYIAQERPRHTVITHDSDCKRRFLCSLGIVSCKFKQHQKPWPLTLGLIFWLIKSFKIINVNKE